MTITDLDALSDRQLAAEMTETARRCLSLASKDGYTDTELLDQAARLCTQALALEPRQTEAYLQLAHLTLITGLLEQTRDLLSQAYLHSPDDPRISVLLDAVATQYRQQQASLPLTPLTPEILAISFRVTDHQQLAQFRQELWPGMMHLND